MHPKIILSIKEIVDISILWILFSLFYAFIKFNDIPEENLPIIYGIDSGATKLSVYMISVFIGLVLGPLLGTQGRRMRVYVS